MFNYIPWFGDSFGCHNLNSMDPMSNFSELAFVGHNLHAFTLSNRSCNDVFSLLDCLTTLYVLYSYVMSVLDRIIVDQYMIVYLHSGAPPNSRPSLQLLRRFYELVDRRSTIAQCTLTPVYCTCTVYPNPVYCTCTVHPNPCVLYTCLAVHCVCVLFHYRFRKQLTALYIVHPTFLVKSILTLARPFIR